MQVYLLKINELEKESLIMNKIFDKETLLNYEHDAELSMSTIFSVLSNKKIDYKTLGAFNSLSLQSDEQRANDIRVFDMSEITQEDLSEYFNIPRQTLLRNIKVLVDSGIIKKIPHPEKKRKFLYEIPQDNKCGCFTLIPQKQLKYMSVSLSSECIKVYCHIKNQINTKKKKGEPMKISNKELINIIGYSTKKTDQSSIIAIVQTLIDCGYINKIQERVSGDEHLKTENYYTLNDWAKKNEKDEKNHEDLKEEIKKKHIDMESIIGNEKNKSYNDFVEKFYNPF